MEYMANEIMNARKLSDALDVEYKKPLDALSDFLDRRAPLTPGTAWERDYNHSSGSLVPVADAQHRLTGVHCSFCGVDLRWDRCDRDTCKYHHLLDKRNEWKRLSDVCEAQVREGAKAMRVMYAIVAAGSHAGGGERAVLDASSHPVTLGVSRLDFVMSDRSLPPVLRQPKSGRDKRAERMRAVLRREAHRQVAHHSAGGGAPAGAV